MTKTKKKDNGNYASLGSADDRVKFLLEECENGSTFQHLSKKQYEELWSLVYDILDKNIGVEEGTSIVQESLSLLESAIKSDSNVAASCTSLLKVLTLLNEKTTSITDSKALNALCKINEIWLAKKDLPVVLGMDAFTLRHLFSLIASVEKPLALDMKRLYSFRSNVSAELLEDHQAVMNKLIQNPLVAASELGQKFIGYVAALTPNLFKNIYKTIALELSSCSKKTSTAYGKTLMMAWNNASADVKSEIQTRFQDLMEEFMKLRRFSLELPKRSSNILSVIDVWNVEVRKKGNSGFSSMITECYLPILWKYLQSGLNFQRCNAADLFLKAFPLQLPGDPDAEAELFTTQLRHMEGALRDDCHIVRIIAVREICNILAVYWSHFSSVQIHTLMSIMTKENAADTASAEVRRTVWRGLESFLSSEPAFSYLQQILPSLRDYVHDVNQRVRIAFIQLLIAIRDKKDPNFKFTAVVPTSALLNCLANENQPVGRWLVRLLLPSLYHGLLEPSEWILRFSVLVKKYPQSYRNFFMYSNKVLSFEDAHVIMCTLLTHLGGYVSKKAKDSDDETSENNPSVANISKRSGSGAKKKSRESSRSENTSTQGLGSCAFDDPAVVTGIFDIVTILWVLHDAQLHKSDNKEALLKLMDSYIQFGQCFINYYKDSRLFNSVVTLSGNVPMALLTANSITLPGYCMKTLKTMKMEAGPEEEADYQTMMVALVKWGCGDQLLEQVTLWLEAAFDSLNQHSTERALKRVKISETIAPNSMVALRLLDTVLRTEHTKTAMFRKNYPQLLELWKMMGNIRELVYRRLLRGQPYSEALLSDEFLGACFRRYLKLLPLLHPLTPEPDLCADGEAKERFDAQAELWAVLQWAQDDLLPMLQADADECHDLDLIAQLVNDVLYVSDNMLTVRLVDESIYGKLGQITISLLTSEHNLHFVKATSRIATAFNFTAKICYGIHGADDHRIWATIVPSLLSHTLNAMVSRPHSPDTLERFMQDFHVVKTNIGKILATYEDNFEAQRNSKESLRSLQLVVEKMLQAVRVVLGREVPRHDLSVPTYSSLSALPPVAATVLAPLYNKPFWTPMFLVVLKQQLGRSVKTLLIDILIIHLFGKIENRNWMTSIQSTLEAATYRLKQFKFRRESGEVRSLGVTLCHVDGKAPGLSDVNQDGDADHCEESGPISQITTGNTISRLVGIDGCSQALEAGDSQPVSNMATICTESRGSQPMSNMATMCTESRGSQPMSNMATICTESRGSQPMSSWSQSQNSQQTSNTGTMDFGPQSSQPLSNMATMGSQPLKSTLDPSSQSCQPVVTTGGMEVDADIPAAKQTCDNRHIPEADLIDDFISCGEELLDTVKDLLAKRATAKQ